MMPVNIRLILDAPHEAFQHVGAKVDHAGADKARRLGQMIDAERRGGRQPIVTFRVPSPLEGEGQGGGCAAPGFDATMPRMTSPMARRLRQAPTDAERKLWSLLRRKQLDGVRFRRQQPIGPYFVDFFCSSCRLVIEVDGGQHDTNREADEKRTAWLATRGYRVLRFWNNEVLTNPDGVFETIRETLRTAHPPP